MANNGYGEVVAIVRKLLIQAKDGITTREIHDHTGFDLHDISSILVRIARQGGAHKTQDLTAGAGTRMRWFRSESDLMAWRAANPPKPPKRKRYPPKVVKPPKPVKVRVSKLGSGERQQAVMRVIREAGSVGIMSGQALTIKTGKPKDRDTALKLLQFGLIFAWPEKGPPGQARRLFATRELAEAYGVAVAAAKAKQAAKKIERPAPVVIKTEAPKPNPAPIITDQTIRTEGRHYTHNYKYQLAPGERIVGGFASAGIGRYLDD